MEITQFSNDYLVQVADLYDRVFTGPPWFDPPLGLEAAMAYIAGELAKPMAQALLAISDFDPIGFAWGYGSTNSKFARTKYEDPVNQVYVARVVPAQAYFYISEVGVDPAFQGQKIGTRLTTELAAGMSPLLMRTLNTSPMLAIATNRLGMMPIVAPWLDQQDPENGNRVVLIKL